MFRLCQLLAFLVLAGLGSAQAGDVVVRVGALEREYTGKADGLDETVSLSEWVGTVCLKRAWLRIIGTATPCVLKCPGQVDSTLSYPNLVFAGALQGEVFRGGLDIQASSFNLTYPLFPALENSSEPLDDVSGSQMTVWFVVKQQAHWPECEYTRAEPSFVIEKFELHVEADS